MHCCTAPNWPIAILYAVLEYQLFYTSRLAYQSADFFLSRRFYSSALDWSLGNLESCCCQKICLYSSAFLLASGGQSCKSYPVSKHPYSAYRPCLVPCIRMTGVTVTPAWSCAPAEQFDRPDGGSGRPALGRGKAPGREARRPRRGQSGTTQWYPTTQAKAQRRLKAI